MGLRSGRPRLDRRREAWAREGAAAAGRVRVPVRLLESDPGQRPHDAPGRRGRGGEPLGHRGRPAHADRGRQCGPDEGHEGREASQVPGDAAPGARADRARGPRPGGAGQRDHRRPGVADARVLPQADRAGLGPARRRLSLQAPRHGAGDQRRGRAGDLYRGASLGRRSERWRGTRPGATGARPSTTTGPSPGGASPSRRPPDPCSGAGRPSQMRARTCATPSVARWSHPS